MEALLTLSDFPDRISPMVVKELRQGLRTRLFVGVLAILHVLLVLLMLISGSSGNDAAASAWFDSIITLVLCAILPLRGFSAMADELKSGTLDMLVLTRLSSGRIVFGKWASITSQSLLIALSILPYVVARYVFGGVDLFGEMLMLFYKWLAGAVVAAAVVALSTQRQFWLRAVLIGLPLLIGGCGMFSYIMLARMGGAAGMPLRGFLSATSIAGPWSVLLIVAAAAWLIFFFLSLGATRHAPAASLLAVVKRSVHLAALGILLVLAATTALGPAAAMAAASMLGLVMMDALTEHVNEVPSVYAAFYRRGWPGRAALWLLAPGWVTGFFFTFLLMVLVGGTVWWLRGAEEALMLCVGACGTWMIAALIQCLPTSRKARDLLLPFICYWLGLTLVISMLAGILVIPFAMKSTTPWFATALPQLVPMGYASAQPGDREALLQIGTLVSLLWPALLLLLALFAWRRARGARQEAWRMVRAEKGGEALA